MKRKAVSIFVVAAMLLGLVFQNIGAAAVDYSYIKVLLVSMGSPASVTFKVEGAYRIAEAPNVDIYPGVTYTAKPTNSGGVSLTYSNGSENVTVSVTGASLTLKQYSNGSSSNYLYVNNPGYGWRYYTGDMLIMHPSGASYLRLVNTLFFETYLYGVVAYEMSNSWPVEALKVQAICARTYAMRYMKSNYSNYYEIGDTSSNQVYKGFPFSSDGTPQQNVINAVNGTRGQVITVGDPTLLSPADGVFSASNGGQIRTAQMRWGSTNTYHVFKEDPYDLNNPSSPTFRYIFPVSASNATLLSGTDASKVDTIYGLMKSKIVAALKAKNFTATESGITISGIKSATPVTLVSGVPAGSHEFSQVKVVVTVKATGSAPQQGHVVTSGGNLNIRSAPSSSGTIVGYAPNGATLTVLDATAATGWYKVQYGSITGYASSAYITLIAPTPTPSAAPTPTPKLTSTPTSTPTTTKTATPTPTPTPTASPAPTITAATASPTASTALVAVAGLPAGELTGAGGGGAPSMALAAATYAGDITITLTYLSKDSDGDYSVHGELKTAFASFSSLIDTGNMWNLYAEKSSDGKFLYVTARGYGHGVGMSQRGAQQMANEGKTCADILEFYFNISTTSASVGTLSLTQKALVPIPGKGASTAVFGTVVAANGVYVRTAAKTAATAIYTLPKSANVEILSTSGDWRRVLYAPAGIVGWACGQSGSTTYISLNGAPSASPAATPTATPTATRTATPTATVTVKPTATLTSTPTAKPTVSTTATPRASTPTPTPTRTPAPTPTPTRTPAPTPTPTRTPTPTPTPTSGPKVLTLKPLTGTAHVTSYLRLRKTASTSASCLIRIPKNAAMMVLQVYTNTNWLKVAYKGKTGFVLGHYVTVGGNTAYRVGTVTASALNVRSNAGTSYKVLGIIVSGNTVMITSSKKVGTITWYKAVCGSVTGWVDFRYMRASP